MIKQNPTYVCDKCGREEDIPFISFEDGGSEFFPRICCSSKVFNIDEAKHFCSIECLFMSIKEDLFYDDET